MVHGREYVPQPRSAGRNAANRRWFRRSISSGPRCQVLYIVIPTYHLVCAPRRLYRVCRSSEPLALPAWEHLRTAERGRYDDPEDVFRVLYASTSKAGAFTEALADLRPRFASATGVARGVRRRAPRAHHAVRGMLLCAYGGIVRVRLRNEPLSCAARCPFRRAGHTQPRSRGCYSFPPRLERFQPADRAGAARSLAREQRRGQEGGRGRDQADAREAPG